MKNYRKADPKSKQQNCDGCLFPKNSNINFVHNITEDNFSNKRK